MGVCRIISVSLEVLDWNSLRTTGIRYHCFCRSGGGWVFVVAVLKDRIYPQNSLEKSHYMFFPVIFSRGCHGNGAFLFQASFFETVSVRSDITKHYVRGGVPCCALLCSCLHGGFLHQSTSTHSLLQWSHAQVKALCCCLGVRLIATSK